MDLGKIGYSDTIVNSANVAATVESGALEVFATPAMIALMEKAACSCIADGLEAGETSVGTAVDITHMAPTPIGVKVEAEAKLGAVFGRRLEFTVTAYDCDEKGERKTQIGSGKHSRVIVDEVKFMSRLQK
ncbi:MAG: thioesterase family protein [Oscillospiraceae bacterium]|nr:thioesterase family protein [Oscillospiraceae bacterium]